jgi:hypothetical protein
MAGTAIFQKSLIVGAAAGLAGKLTMDYYNFWNAGKPGAVLEASCLDERKRFVHTRALANVKQVQGAKTIPATLVKFYVNGRRSLAPSPRSRTDQLRITGIEINSVFSHCTFYAPRHGAREENHVVKVGHTVTAPKLDTKEYEETSIEEELKREGLVFYKNRAAMRQHPEAPLVPPTKEQEHEYNKIPWRSLSSSAMYDFSVGKRRLEW